MARSSNRGGRNNNPSGRNQYSDWGVMEMARERPIAAAAADGSLYSKLCRSEVRSRESRSTFVVPLRNPTSRARWPSRQTPRS